MNLYADAAKPFRHVSFKYHHTNRPEKSRIFLSDEIGDAISLSPQPLSPYCHFNHRPPFILNHSPLARRKPRVESMRSEIERGRNSVRGDRRTILPFYARRYYSVFSINIEGQIIVA